MDTVLKKLDGIDLTIQEVRQEQKAQREKNESLEAAVQLIQPCLKKHGGMLQVLKDSSTTAEVFFGQIRATVCTEPPTSTGTVPEGFCVEAMSTGEQVVEFEQKLVDNEYFKHVVD